MDMQDRIVVYHPYGREVLVLDGMQDDVLFALNEFEYVEIENLTKDVLSFEQANSDELRKLMPGEKCVLNDYDYMKEGTTFFPERYVIYLDEACIRPYFFEVKSNALGGRINDIRDIIEEFAKGLSKDVNKLRIDRFHHRYKTLYEHMISNEKALLCELEYIIDHPAMTLSKQLMPTLKDARMTRMSEKKESDRHDYRYKSIATYNNSQNIALKNAIFKIIKQYDEVIDDMQQQVYSIEERKSSNENYRNRYLDKQMRIIHERMHHLQSIRNRIHQVMNDTWLRTIEMRRNGYEVPSFYDFHYKKIQDASKGMNINTRLQSNAYKKTSELYELYALIVIMKILEIEGFELMSESDMHHILEGDEFVFIKNEKRIQIAFNKIIQPTDALPKDQLVIQNGRSNKPDLTLLIYDNDVLVDCLIFEVKCRRKHNFYNPDVDTSVMRQLRDYTNLWYFDASGKLHKGAVSQVYVLYPGYDASIEYVNANQICMLSLEGTKNYMHTDSFNQLHMQLKQFIG